MAPKNHFGAIAYPPPKSHYPNDIPRLGAATTHSTPAPSPPAYHRLTQRADTP